MNIRWRHPSPSSFSERQILHGIEKQLRRPAGSSAGLWREGRQNPFRNDTPVCTANKLLRVIRGHKKDNPVKTQRACRLNPVDCVPKPFGFSIECRTWLRDKKLETMSLYPDRIRATTKKHPIREIIRAPRTGRSHPIPLPNLSLNQGKVPFHFPFATPVSREYSIPCSLFYKGMFYVLKNQCTSICSKHGDDHAGSGQNRESQKAGQEAGPVDEEGQPAGPENRRASGSAGTQGQGRVCGGQATLSQSRVRVPTSCAK